ncbi:hypothetical protein ACVWYH_005961 [Bradyrhizobium sp. GM24.11]
MRIALIFAWTSVLAGCAANSGVAPTGPDSFVVSRQAATGFSGSGTLKGEALTEAGQFCASQKKTLLVTDSKEAAPPYVMGNFPKAEVGFMCLPADDPRLATQQHQVTAVTAFEGVVVQTTNSRKR